MEGWPSRADWSSDWTRPPVEQMPRADLLKLLRVPFLRQAGPAQRPPQGDWSTWLFMGGRGSGKTRAGAEWLRFALLYGGCRRAALVGPTLTDVREVMIEGPSGLRALACGAGAPAPEYEASRRRLVFENGAEAFAFSSEDHDSLRGPQFDVAWCDEIAAWTYPDATWDMLQFALRLGETPRALATTTPRPTGLVRRLVDAPGSIVTRARTGDNAHNLAPGFLSAVERAYGGTRLGRQELDGELLEDDEGCLWTHRMIEAARQDGFPGRFEEVVVAIDPPAGASPTSDACGIIAAGRASELGVPARCFILADSSAQGLAPLDWGARAVSLAAQLGARCIVAEANQGGEMVRHTLETAGCRLPVRLVRASLGKRERALPVAALYGRGRVVHAGGLDALEDEMCTFGTQGQGRSPDRVDALVWAVWSLMLEGPGAPRVRPV